MNYYNFNINEYARKNYNNLFIKNNERFREFRVKFTRFIKYYNILKF